MLYVGLMNKTLIIITLCLLDLWVTVPRLLSYIVFVYLLIYLFIVISHVSLLSLDMLTLIFFNPF